MISDADYELNAIVEELGSLNKALCYFSCTGNLNLMSIAIDRGADVNAKDQYGNTPLHHAAESGRPLAAKLLIEKGATVSIKNENGYTPLHWAVYNGDAVYNRRLEVVQYLIESKATVDAKSDIGNTPLHLAAYSGHTEIVKLLIENGATVSSIRDEDGYTPLHAATNIVYPADSGHTEAAKLLIENGADVDAKDVHGDTVLHFAAEKGHLETAKLLIDKGAKVNTKGKNGNTPLHLAAEMGHPLAAKLLLNNGANIILKNNEGRTPIDIRPYYFREHFPELYAIYNIVAEHRTQQVTKEDGTVESVVNFKENDGKIISQFYNQYRDISVGVINAKYRDFIIEKINSPPSLQYLAANTANKATVGDNSKISELPLPESIKDNIRNPKKVIMNGDFYAFEERGITSPSEELAAAASTSTATNITDSSEESAARSSARG